MNKLSKVLPIPALLVLASGTLASCGGHQHNYVHHDAVASNCLTTGMQGYYSCSGCELIFTEEKVETTLEDLVTPIGAHALAHHDAVIPQCEVPGNIEYWSCDVCEKMFSDANAKHQITDPSVTKDHTYGSWVEEIEATCEHTGMLGHYHCADCGKYFDSTKKEVSYDSLIIPLGEHVSDGHYESNDTTHWTTCSVCGEHLTQTHDHKYILDGAGEKYEWKCACGHKGTGHEDINAKVEGTQSVAEYVFDGDASKYVANENAGLSYPGLPTGATLKGLKIGTDSIAGAAFADGVVTVGAAAIENYLGETKNVEATFTVEGCDVKVMAEGKFITAEVATAKQFSFIHWTSEADAGNTKSSGAHPFVKEENGNKYIDGYFVMTDDINAGGGTINERDSDLGYAGQPKSGGWNSLKGFRGTFDGQGHKFDDITFVAYGLFGAIGKGGLIKNFDITCTNGYSTRVHQAMTEACMIAAQVYTATIENVNVVHTGADDGVSANTHNAIFVGDMIDARSVVKNCYIKVRSGYHNIFGTRTTGSVTFENVTVEVWKQYSADPVRGITNFYGGNSDSYPTCTEAPAGITVVMPA